MHRGIRIEGEEAGEDDIGILTWYLVPTSVVGDIKPCALACSQLRLDMKPAMIVNFLTICSPATPVPGQNAS